MITSFVAFCICSITRLIIESSFELTFWTQIDIESNCSHFQLDSSWIAHIFNLMQLDSTENWINSTWFIKNSSLMSRELNIEIFPIFCFCITFLHYLFDRESWRETWRLYDRESWREVIVESHDRKSWRENMKIVWWKVMKGNMKENMKKVMTRNMKGKHEGRLTLVGSHDGETW